MFFLYFFLGKRKDTAEHTDVKHQVETIGLDLLGHLLQRARIDRAHVAVHQQPRAPVRSRLNAAEAVRFRPSRVITTRVIYKKEHKK